MKLIAKKRFGINGIIYEKGDEIKVQNKEQLIKLNENGFIEPLSIKDIQNFGKKEIQEIKKEPKFENKKNNKEEE